MTSDTADMDVNNVPQFQKSNTNVQSPPFPTLMGEKSLLLSKTIDGTAMVTNFRLCVCERRSFINVPLMMVGELTVLEASRWMRIGCKDGANYCCTFATSEDLHKCSTLLRESIVVPRRENDLFAYHFHSTAMQKLNSGAKLTETEQEQMALCRPVSEAFAYSFGKEVERLGFDTNRRMIWRMSHANESYEYCPTYPKLHILPATVDDSKLKESLDFRALKRFPSVVWRDRGSGVVLVRSSQPLSSFLGMNYYTNMHDVGLLDEIVKACNREREVLQSRPSDGETDQNGRGPQVVSQGQGDAGANGAQGSLEEAPQHGAASTAASSSNDAAAGCKLAIVDCRSSAGVWGNSLKGGGTEDEVVYKCSTINLDLANIHSVRDSLTKLRNLCHTYTEGSFYNNLTRSNWLAYISALLRGANIVVELMKVKQRPVLVHCSDGWDRTSQICSLSELMMDPYYRTIEGFQVLVEREWLHFGHKFGERGGHDPKCTDYSQMSPIFLQFLDCVYQLTLQNPSEFEFNETYLIKLLKHSQACLFGTFLHNCQREREQCKQQTASVWTLLRPGEKRLSNPLYRPRLEVLTAHFSEHEVVLWQAVYMEGHRRQADFYLDSLLPLEGGARAEGVPRSRSMDDLTRGSLDSGRRNSDPSLAPPGQESAAAAPTSPHDTSSSSTEILHYPEDSPPGATEGGENSLQRGGSVVASSPKSRTESSSSSRSPGQTVETVVAEGASECVGEVVEEEEEEDGSSSKVKCLSESSSCSSNLSSQQSLTSSIISCEVTDHDKEADAPPAVLGVIPAVQSATAPPAVDTDNADSTTEQGAKPTTVEGASPLVVESPDSVSQSCSDSVAQCSVFQAANDRPEVSSPAFQKHSNDKSSLLAERLAQVDIGPRTIDLHSNGLRSASTTDKHQELSPVKPGASNGVRHSSSTNGTPVKQEASSTNGTPVKQEASSTNGTPVKHEETASPVKSLEKTPPSLSSSHTSSSTISQTSPAGQALSHRARAASGASRDLSVSPGNWTDTGRLRHPSNSSDGASRRLQCVRSSVSTSTTDISDSCVAQAPPPSGERGGGIRGHIDVDGLTLHVDPRQELLTQMLAARDHKIQELEQRLLSLTDMVRKAKAYVAGQQAHPPAGLDEVPVASSDSELGGGGPGSLGTTSNDSWEPLDEAEAKVQPWVPDHTVTHCAACDCLFWMGRRKHHCRNCGKVFCDECTSYRAPVLHAHLNTPERVCRSCHDTLLQLSPGASSDGRIPTLVADG